MRLAVALAGSIAAVTLLVANPLTHPTSVGEAAIEVDAHSALLEMGADLILQQPEPSEEEERPPPLTSVQEERLRSLLHEAFTADWAGAAIRSAAEGMEVWISSTRRPDVYLHLTEPKERIRNHPDAVLLVTATADPEETDRSLTEAPDTETGQMAVDAFLNDIPDRISLVETSWWSDFIDRAGDLREETTRIGVISTMIAVLAAIIGVAMTTGPRLASVSSWLGWLMLWTAIPVLLISGAAPAAASGIPLPDELALATDVIAETWETARLIGWSSIGGALVLWALVHVIRERHTSAAIIPEEVETEERSLVEVG